MKHYKLSGQISPSKTGDNIVALYSEGLGAKHASSFVSSSGFFGCRAQILPKRTMGGENRPLAATLLAAQFATRCIETGAIVFQTSSEPALFYLQAWLTGSSLLPPRYAEQSPSGRDSKLKRLATLMSQEPNRFTCELVSPRDSRLQVARTLATMAFDKAVGQLSRPKEADLAYAEEYVQRALAII